MGRIRFSDPLGIVATGLFDGLAGSLVLGKARFSAGALYTGLLYKETAKVIMTAVDLDNYTTPLDYGDGITYFSSRRMLAHAGAEFSDLTPRTTLAVNLLGQFDLNPGALAGESAFHSQYLTIRYTLLPLDTLTVSGTVVGGLGENQDGTYAQFAAAGGIAWDVPGNLRDMIQGEFRWSSGANEGARIIAFVPVTSIGQGQIFNPRLSGLMKVMGKYTVRPHQAFSSSLEGALFIRTDGETLTGTDYPSSSSRYTGFELYGNLIWAPAEDLMVTLGGGAFFPGAVFVPDTPVRWKVAVGLIFSL
jgi:hypothetical protein